MIKKVKSYKLQKGEKFMKFSDSAKEHYNYGIEKLVCGNYEEAIKNFDEVIKINPNYEIAYNSRGVAKSIKGG